MITRTKHIVMAIGLVERMSDTELTECFTSTATDKGLTAKEAREYLKELRAAGYEYFPCSCEQVNDDGSCMGWEKVA